MSRVYNRKKLEACRRQLRRDQTEAEKVLWERLRNRALLGVKFRRQYSVENYVIDFYAPALKLAVEVDGGIHEGKDQQEYDQLRTYFLKGYGISILRISNQCILRETDRAVERIAAMIRASQPPGI